MGDNLQLAETRTGQRIVHTGEVIRFHCRHRLTQLRQLTRPRRSIHACACQGFEAIPVKSPDSVARWERRGWSAAYRLHHSVALIIGEKENLVANDRAAKCSAELVLVVSAFLPRWIEVVARIQIGVAQEFEDVSVPLVCAGFGYDVDLRAGIIAVFGIGVVGQNAKFRDGIEVRNRARTRISNFLNVSIPFRMKPFAASRMPLTETAPAFRSPETRGT